MEYDYNKPVNKEVLINLLEKLYKSMDHFPYAALAIILQPTDLFNFLDCFGGTTFKVPTKTEMVTLIQVTLVNSLRTTLGAVDDSELFDLAKASNPEALTGLSKQKFLSLSSKIN